VIFKQRRCGLGNEEELNVHKIARHSLAFLLASGSGGRREQIPSVILAPLW
jgi:hypothetical protein